MISISYDRFKKKNIVKNTIKIIKINNNFQQFNNHKLEKLETKKIKQIRTNIIKILKIEKNMNHSIKNLLSRLLKENRRKK